MTATVTELRPEQLQPVGIDRDLKPRVLAPRRMTVAGYDADDRAYRDSSPRLKLAAWITFVSLCLVSWWIIAKLLLIGWYLIAS
jgi:hypothetical protein